MRQSLGMEDHAKDTHILRVHHVVYRILPLLARAFFVLDRNAVCAYNARYQGNEEKEYPRCPRLKRASGWCKEAAFLRRIQLRAIR